MHKIYLMWEMLGGMDDVPGHNGDRVDARKK
jgi:hypothetical protein